MANRNRPLVTIVLAFACAGRGQSSELSDGMSGLFPVFSWQALPMCAPRPEYTEATVEREVRLGSSLVRLRLPTEWNEDTASQADGGVRYRLWTAPSGNEWVALRALGAHDGIWGAHLYLTERFHNGRGDTSQVHCPHCVQIQSRCRTRIGEREALMTNGHSIYADAVVTVLWPLSAGGWLALEASSRDSTLAIALESRARSARF